MLFVLFIIGAIFGSFYTVLATRLPQNKSIITPPSHCDNCQKRLLWYELIPILSYLFLRGRCLKCHKKISPLSTIVELCLGICFALIYYFYGLSYEAFIMYILVSLTIIIFISDFKYMIIEDIPLIFTVIFIFIVKIYFINMSNAFLGVINGFAVFIVIYIIKICGDKAFKQESLGGGDVKLGFIMGFVLGIRFGLIAFALGALIALPYALLLVKIKKEHLLAFGPFLALSIIITFLFKDYILMFLRFL